MGRGQSERLVPSIRPIQPQIRLTPLSGVARGGRGASVLALWTVLSGFGKWGPAPAIPGMAATCRILLSQWVSQTRPSECNVQGNGLFVFGMHTSLGKFSL